jgi:hypothetical protein
VTQQYPPAQPYQQPQSQPVPYHGPPGLSQPGLSQPGLSQPGYGGPYPPAARPPRPVGYPVPSRIEAVPGTPFAVAILPVPVAASGPAVGALVAGIAAVLVSSTVWIFGLIGAASGNGGLAGGAFALLTGALGVAALVLGWLGRRQVGRSAGAFSGRGTAMAGMICGAVGLLIGAGGELFAVLSGLG